MLDILSVHHILKNTAVQNINKPFVYITVPLYMFMNFLALNFCVKLCFLFQLCSCKFPKLVYFKKKNLKCKGEQINFDTELKLLNNLTYFVLLD